MREYEISLWTQDDTFIEVLGTNGSFYGNKLYNPVLNLSLDALDTLTFNIPIIYKNNSNDIINNSMWYEELVASGKLANERKVKLIFNKSAALSTGINYTVYEFVIQTFTEKRTDKEVYCEVTCNGLAGSDLGKNGVNIVLDSDTILSEEEESGATITPTLNYWADKIFPKEGEVWTTGWGYKVQMDYSYEILPGRISTKCYEDDNVIGYDESNSPVYNAEPIEKVRFISIKDSNRYNITQDLAETFGIYVKYVYGYDDPSNPFKITSKTVVFYNSLIADTNFTISYGNNQRGISKVASSDDIRTKIYVANLENEDSVNGFLSIADAPSNYTKDSFILNFGYYIERGQLSVERQELIPTFETNIRAINTELSTILNTKYAKQNEKISLEVQQKNLEDQIAAAATIVNDCTDKINGIGAALSTQILRDNKIALITKKLDDNSNQLIFTRNGVMDSNFSIVKPNGDSFTTYTKVYNQYGFIASIYFNKTSIATGAILYATYDYDVLSYYRYLLNTYQTAHEAYKIKYDTATADLARVTEELADIESQYEEAVNQKQNLIKDFDNKMGYFLKEGTWTPSSYSSPSENKSKTIIINNSYLDSVSASGEQLSYYLVGSAPTYYNYIIADTFLSSNNIKNLTVYKKNSILNSKNIYVVGAHFTIEYYKINDLYYKVLLFDKDVVLNSNGADKFYYVDSTGNEIEITQFFQNAYTDNNKRGSIVYLRYVVDETNTYASTINVNIATTEELLESAPLSLQLYYDYNITNNSSGQKVITFKNYNINFPVLPFYANITYKCDRTVDQLYYDALDVAQTAGYPTASYEINFTELKHSLNKDFVFPMDAAHTYLSADANARINLTLGSIVRVNDTVLHLTNIKGLVNKLTVTLENPANDKITIQNYKTKFTDLFTKIVKSTETLQNNLLGYNRAATAILPTGEINISLLQNAIDRNNLILRSGHKSGVTQNEDGILIKNLTPYPTGAYGMVALRGGGIFLSDSEDSSGAPIFLAAITPKGINANAITSGRIDTEKINIYSGDQIRFTWKADGLFAYKQLDSGAVDYSTYVKYHEGGLLFEQNNMKIVELGWDGLYIGAQDGSLELTGENGFTLYDEPQDALNRGAIIQIGRFTSGGVSDYGLRMFKRTLDPDTLTYIYSPTLTTTSNGQLWLKDTLQIGQDDNYIGISGVGNAPEAIRIWAGAVDPTEAPFLVYQNGNLVASNVNLSGMIEAQSGSFSGVLYASRGFIGGWTIDGTELHSALSDSGMSSTTQSEGKVFWAGGQENPTFYVTYNGILNAIGANLNGAIVDGTIIAQQGEILGDLKIGKLAPYTYLGSINGTIAEANARDTTVGIQYTDKFVVYQSGRIKATDADISGKITGASGSIGGWGITANGIISDNGMVGLSSTNIIVDNIEDNKRFYVKNPSQTAYIFYVDSAGKLYSSNAEIKGNVIVDSGYVNNLMRIGSADSGILLQADDGAGHSAISSTQYMSSSLGYGWKISETGEAFFSNISARGKIRSSIFEYKKVSCVGGNLYVAPTIYLETESSTITLVTKNQIENSIPVGQYYRMSWQNIYSTDNNINGKDWLAGDEILFEGELTVGASKKSYSNIIGYIEVDPDDSISLLIPVNNVADTLTALQFYPGSIIVFYGRQGNRQGLYLTAMGDNLEEGPFLDVFDSSSDHAPPAVRLGNLAGIVDNLFYTQSLNGYGLYASNAYLRGQVMLPNAGITNQNDIIYPEGSGTPIRIWAGMPTTEGAWTPADANFIVTEDGSLYAKQGIFEGVIKATDSEFSGTLKAAGIIVSHDGSGLNPIPNMDHFFVGYSGSPVSFNDYILDISSKGLSIWEAGFRVYSDYAAGWRDTDVTAPSGDVNSIYGYTSGNVTDYNPIPIIAVADDGTGENAAVLDSRLITYKSHILKLIPIDGSSDVNYESIQLDNGIWFSSGIVNTNNGVTGFNCEPVIFKDNNNRKVGIDLKTHTYNGLANKILTLNGDKGINLKSVTYINGTDEDLVQDGREETLVINGIVKIKNTDDRTQNKLLFNEQEVIEIFDGDVSIGLNIIIR